MARLATLLLKMLAIGLLAVSCSSNIRSSSSQEERSGAVRCFYSWGFEVEAFQPCGSKEGWWVVSMNPEAGRTLSRRYREATSGPYQRVYAELKGTPSTKGRFGHMGAYDREFALEEVILVREARPGDCK
jgi:hypothetical protein